MQLYTRQYKRYIAIPAVLFLIFLYLAFISPGLERGIDLQGGNLIIIRADTELPQVQLESFLNEQFDLSDLQVNTISSPTGGYGATIQFSQNAKIASAQEAAAQARSLLPDQPEAAAAAARESISLSTAFLPEVPDISSLTAAEMVAEATRLTNEAESALLQSITTSIQQEFNLSEHTRFQQRTIGPVLGDTFYDAAVTVSITALILVTIVIFLFFRKIVPSLAVMLAAIFDIFAALGCMALLNIPLSLSTIPALLMLVGYSIDTDIMLTTRLLKRGEGSIMHRTHQSLTTGLTMTLTTAAALLSMVFFSFYAQISVIFDIAIVLFFGLLGDLISTWLMNAPILLWYLERKGEEVV